MKKVIFSIVIVLCCGLVMSGCKKHDTLTITPSMVAYIGADTFTAVTIAPSVVTSQANDTTNTLIINGNTNLLQAQPGDQIILSITKYKNATGTFSMVQNQASGIYIHNGITSVGTGGIISITNITSNSIIGYFSFTTADGLSVANGTFNIGKPE